MLPAKSCGRTTQKIVLSVSKGSASRVVSTVTTTSERSGAMAMLVTVPITTFLYLSWDWPAVRPAAVSKVMVMVGPRLEKVSQASHRAIRPVSRGTIQTRGMRRRRRTPAVGSSGGPACSLIPALLRLPARKVAERHVRKHGDHGDQIAVTAASSLCFGPRASRAQWLHVNAPDERAGRARSGRWRWTAPVDWLAQASV